MEGIELECYFLFQGTVEISEETDEMHILGAANKCRSLNLPVNESQ